MTNFKDAVDDMADFINNLPFISPVLRQEIFKAEQEHINMFTECDYMTDTQKAQIYAPHLFKSTIV